MTNGTVREANLSLVRRMRRRTRAKYRDALESDVFILTGAEDLDDRFHENHHIGGDVKLL
jgi:hypothetical protein